MSKPQPQVTTHSDSFMLYGGALALLLLGFVLAYQFVEPAPPKQLRISTGSPQNAYFQYASQYAEILARQGIELQVDASAGSVENLQRLANKQTDIALVQGGIDHPDRDQFRSLGSLYFEPLWLFYRKSVALDKLTDLQGKKVAIGSEGSGTRAVALQLLNANGIDSPRDSGSGSSTVAALQKNRLKTQLKPIGGQPAVDALKAGELDALFIVTSPSSELIQQLITHPDIGLFSFRRAEAYQSQYHFLSSVTLPEGVFDLANNIPNRPIQLLAPTATLVTRSDFHPALTAQLLQAARQVHGQGGLFEQPGQFPSKRFINFELNPDAERYYRSGPPFLQRYLPFWAANLIDRLVIMLVPIITLMIPLTKVLPPTYRWRIRSRIYRWYGQLRELDFRAEQITDIDQAHALLADLARIEREVMQVAVPKSYAENQYNLRLHLRLIRERLEHKLVEKRAAAS